MASTRKREFGMVRNYFAYARSKTCSAATRKKWFARALNILGVVLLYYILIPLMVVLVIPTIILIVLYFIKTV